VLAISTTLQCTAPTVDYVIKRIEAEVLPHFSNVDDVIALTHTYGCGIAIDVSAADIPIRTFAPHQYARKCGWLANNCKPWLRETAA
jgi:altronate dehydratase